MDDSNSGFSLELVSNSVQIYHIKASVSRTGWFCKAGRLTYGALIA